MLLVFVVSQCSNYTFAQGNVTVVMDNSIGGGPGSKNNYSILRLADI